MADLLPFETVRDMDDKELRIMMIQALNTLNKEVEKLGHGIETYTKLIDGKIGRDEFAAFQKKTEDEMGKMKTDITTLQNVNENGDLKKNTLLGAGKTIWLVVLGCMNLLQFLIILFQIGESAGAS